MIEQSDLVIEYSLDGGAHWHHGKTVPGWVRSDKAAMSGQRAAVRQLARHDHGDVERITTRVLPEHDPRAVVNQLAGGTTVTVSVADLELVLPRVEHQLTLTWDERAAVNRLRTAAGLDSLADLRDDNGHVPDFHRAEADRRLGRRGSSL